MNNILLYDIAKILVSVAKENETITYNQLSQKLKNQIKPINLGHPIGELSKICYELGLPLISVLVVNQDTGIPGDGFYKLCSDLKGISEEEAMINLEKEKESVHKCSEWNKLLEYFNVDKINSEKKEMTRKVTHNKPKYWLVVHDIDAYNENPRLLGFSNKIYNAKNIKPKDKVVYYLSGTSTIKGIYEVSDKPWKRDPRWSSVHQIQIQPILELENEIDFKTLVPHLNLFVNKEKWFTYIQGTNAVRELPERDYKFIEKSVIKASINNNEQNYLKVLEDDKKLTNESIEVKINRIKRYQQIVNELKRKYQSRCQIEGCNFTFKKKNGEYYSEGHHLKPLSEGGSQTADNIVILCPNHHRMFHYADVKIFKLKGNRRKVLINGKVHYIKY